MSDFEDALEEAGTATLDTLSSESVAAVLRRLFPDDNLLVPALDACAFNSAL